MTSKMNFETASRLLSVIGSVPIEPMEMLSRRADQAPDEFKDAPEGVTTVDIKKRELTPIERRLQDLQYYSRTGRKLPEIPAEYKNLIDYYVISRNNEAEPSIPQLIQQVLIDFLKTTPTDLITIGTCWGRYLRPMISYSFDKLIDGSGKYKKIDFLREHPNGASVSSSLKTHISPVEVAYRKTANVPTAGTYFLEWGSERLVVSFDFDGSCCSLSATVSNENKSVGETFLSNLNESLFVHNIYRNKVLEMVDGNLVFTKTESIKLKNVFLPKRIRVEVEENTLGVLAHKEKLLKTPSGINRSIILAGNPGTGKTQLFKAISNSVQECTVIWVSSKAFNYVSDVSQLYAAARDLSPTLLVIEDMDLIGSERSSQKDNKLLGEFLTQMSGSVANEKIITLASTNSLETIDEALRNRPGRFDRVIIVKTPNRRYRRRMLEAFLSELKVRLEVSDQTWESVISETRGLTGAHLKEIAKTTLIKAIVNKKDDDDEIVLIKDEDLVEATTLVTSIFRQRNK
jgi:cell division protease FtsH